MDATCSICQAGALQPKYRIKQEMIYRCSRCGTETWDWHDTDPARLYGDAYFRGGDRNAGFEDYASLQDAVRCLARRRTAMLRRLLPDGKNLVEVGCAYGYFLDEARKAGFDVWGVDISPHARSVAQTKYSLRVFADIADLHDVPAGQVDVVAMWDTLEHLPEPGRALQSAGSLLRPGGLVAISTGVVDTFWSRIQGRHWHLYSLPEHLFFFSRAGLATLLRREGFTDVVMQNEWASYPVWYLLERLERGILKREVSRPDKVRHGILGLKLPASLGTVQRIVARKAVPA